MAVKKSTATKVAEATFLDTNVLVDATDELRPRHEAALTALESGRRWAFSAQIAREYLVVATRPPDSNGLGLPPSEALANLAEFRRVVRLLPEERPLLSAFLDLLQEVPCEGKTIHDALVVATMRVHRIGALLTSNPAHFARFQKLIRITALPS